MSTITCTFVEYHDDMYPEFAPEPIAVPCTEVSTVWIRGEDEPGFTYEAVVCPRHAAMLAPSTLETVPVTANFAEGWALGVTEAEAVTIDDNLAAFILHEGVPEARPSRLPITTEFGHGFTAGWDETLATRASELYRQASSEAWES